MGGKPAFPLLAQLSLPAPAAGAEPDGADDGVAAQQRGPGLEALARANRARFEKHGPAAGTHPLVCDLLPFAGALYAATSVAPISLDGARVFRYAGGRFTLAFDWDRGGGPKTTTEVGGQGITRLRAIGGRIYATDSDAPKWGGFGLSGSFFEDYLFVSGTDGVFPPLGPGLSPPGNTVVLPLAYHSFDVIRYRGAMVASGGTVNLDRGAPNPYPGGLFVGGPDDALLRARFRPGAALPVGVTRVTFLHRFAGRLYMGFQNNKRRARWDIGVLSGDPRDPHTAPPVLARITPDGGWLTRRFASGAGRLYWIGSRYPGEHRPAVLYVSRDGLAFTRVDLPADAGPPHDLVVVGDSRYLLARGGLYRARGDGEQFTRIAAAPAGDPFGGYDLFCGAPLTVYDDALWAGSTRDGALYRVVPE